MIASSVENNDYSCGKEISHGQVVEESDFPAEKKIAMNSALKEV
jgi:hypothetical protein